MVNDIAFTEAARTPDPERLAHRLPPVGVDPEPAAGLHQGRLRRPEPRARLEPGVRRRQPARVARYEQIADEIDRALQFMRACGIDTDHRAPAARGRLLHEPRGARAGLRGGPHPPGLAHRRLVRLLGPHAVDRRAHPPARRRPRRVLRRRRQPGRLQGRARRPPPTRCWRCARRSTPSGCPGRLTLITRMGADARRRRAPAAARGRPRRRPPRGVGLRPDARQHLHRAQRPQDPPLRRRPGRDRAASSAPTAPRAPGPAASTSSSPATT